jgi:hypothetical protein
MDKVYIIRYEETYSDGTFHAGVMYTYKKLEDAEKMLDTIKREESEYYVDGGWEEEDIKERTHDLITENGFIFDFGDEYTKYIIEEMEVK